MRPNATKYKYNIYEVADTLKKCRLFPYSVSYDDVVKDLNSPKVQSHESFYCHVTQSKRDYRIICGVYVNCIFDEGEWKETSTWDSKGKQIFHVDVYSANLALFGKYGAICMACKEKHYDFRYDNTHTDFLIRKSFIDMTGTCEVSPLCTDCRTNLSDKVFRYKRGILYGIANPTDEQVDVAVAHWAANKIIRIIDNFNY